MKKSLGLVLFISVFLSVWYISWTFFMEEPQELPKETPPVIYNLTFAGDLMAHAPNFEMENYNSIYREVREILWSDHLSFINLETPVVDSLPNRSYPLFNVHSEYVEAAIAGGFNVFSLANNHSCDQGMDGVRATLTQMKELEKMYGGFYYNGIRFRPEAPVVPETIELGDVKFGFLSVAGFMNQWKSEQGKDLVYVFYHQQPPVQEAFLKYLEIITPQYDYFILSFHGGKEYWLEPWDKKKDLFKKLLNSGVDLIWGHHPHVVQPMEIIEVQGEKKLVLNSAGNFVSGQTWLLSNEDYKDDRAYTGDSALYKVALERKDQKLRLKEVTPIPITHFKTKDGVEVRLLNKLSEQLGEHSWANYYKERAKIMAPFWTVAGLEEEEEEVVGSSL